MSAQTILVIDDSPTLLKVVQLVLGEAGLHVVAAPNADAGLAAVRAERPALVLLDDVLGDKPALSLCEHLADQKDAPKVVLLRSGLHVDDPLKWPGVVDAIAKPFTPDALRAVVSHLVTPGTAPRRRLSLTPPPQAPAATPSVTASDLAGSLAIFGVSDVFALLSEARKTGDAWFSRGASKVRVRFETGRVAFARAERVPEEFLLGRFLCEQGYIDANTLEAVATQSASARPSGATFPRLGQALIARGLISRDQLDEGMRLQTAALVYELLRWDTGGFTFVATPAASGPTAEPSLDLSVDHLVMEGLRRIDEWRLIEQAIDDFDAIYLREDDRMATLGPGRLLRDEIAVAEQLNGRNTVRDVIFQTHMGSFEVCRVLYRLRKSKLIRPRVTPAAP